MKITKSQLREIIEDELRKDAPREVHEEEETDYISNPDVACGELWEDLNYLLKKWTDKEHEYYIQLRDTMENYAVEEEVEEGEEETTKAGEARRPQSRVGFYGGDAAATEDLPSSGDRRVGFQESIEALVREMLQSELEERKKKRSVKSERRTRGRSALRK